MQVLRRFYALSFKAWTQDGEAIDPLVAFEALASMPYAAATPCRELKIQAGQFRAVKVESIDRSSKSVRGWVSNIRMNDVPKAKNRQERERLVDLSADEGLDYSCNFILQDFAALPPAKANPDTQAAVLVFESVHSAPHFEGFERYLNRVFKNRWTFSIAPIVAKDGFDRLKKKTEVSKVFVHLHVDSIHDSLSSWLPRAKLDGGYIEIAMRAENRKKLPVTPALVSDLQQLATRNDVASLVYEEAAGHLVDLLSDRLKFFDTILVAEGRSRAPRRQDVFESISRTFADNRKQLAKFVGRKA